MHLALSLLPEDVWDVILSHLELRDVARLSRCSKTMRRAVDTDRTFAGIARRKYGRHLARAHPHYGGCHKDLVRHNNAHNGSFELELNVVSEWLQNTSSEEENARFQVAMLRSMRWDQRRNRDEPDDLGTVSILIEAYGHQDLLQLARESTFFFCEEDIDGVTQSAISEHNFLPELHLHEEIPLASFHRLKHKKSVRSWRCTNSYQLCRFEFDANKFMNTHNGVFKFTYGGSWTDRGSLDHEGIEFMCGNPMELLQQEGRFVPHGFEDEPSDLSYWSLSSPIPTSIQNWRERSMWGTPRRPQDRPEPYIGGGSWRSRADESL